MVRCMGCMNEYDDGLTVCPHCGYAQGTPAREAYHLPPETILNGRYLVGRVLGFGGFGTTYIAWDLVLEKKVAIKEYMPSDFSTRAPGETQLSVYDGELGEQFRAGLKSFIDESRRLAKFNHEDGIVHIFDSFSENATAYIVMEYLEGKTLKELLKERGGKIPYEEAVGYILPVLKSLDAVHQTGIIHRDIAPDNIFLTNDGKVKLIDFGASRYATTLHSKSLSVILKQGYAPEEQYRSHGEQGPWSDVYAVCATLYRTITGIVPEDALERCANDKLVPPSKMGIQLPQGIENAILNGLNTKAENRIQSAKELAQALSGEIEVQRVKEEKKKEDVGKWSKKQIIIASCSGVAVIAVVILAILGVFSLNKSLDTTLYATVPDYIGMTLDEAQADWASYCETEGITNISLSVLDGVTADTITGYEVNQIYAVAPEVGSWFKKAEMEQKYLYVTVVLKSVQQMIEENQGKDSWVMQNLENYSQADAQRILESMVGVNFTFETIASEKSTGTVIRTEPAAGTQINKGDTIVVYISDGSQINVVETVDEEVVRQEENGANHRPEGDNNREESTKNNPETTTGRGSDSNNISPTDPPEDATVIANGQCGDNAFWSLDSNGLLNITGTGKLYDYEQDGVSWITSFRPDIRQAFISNGITHIGNFMFRQCTNLRSIALPKTLLTIGIGAFQECSSLSAVDLPDSVASIGPIAFESCNSLTHIVIPKGVPAIEVSTFSYCEKLSDVHLPDSVQYIGEMAFYNTSLEKITIPGSVDSIGDSAFASCYKLTEVIIQNGTEHLGAGIFSYCLNLQTISLPQSLIDIDGMDDDFDFPFRSTEKLQNIHVDPKNQNYSSIDGVLFNKDATKLLAFPSGRMGSYTIPDTVTTVGCCAFRDSALSELTVPYTVTHVQRYGFDFEYHATIYIKGRTSLPPGWEDSWYGFTNDNTIVWNA